MRLSTKGRYGLRIMLELALRQGEGPVQVATIARSQDLPPKYVHVLAGGLKGAGLLLAARGPAGGLALARDPGAITVLDVVTALEGPPAAVDCVLDPAPCARSGGCATREVWDELTRAMEDVLRRHTLASLAERQRALRAADSGWAI